MKIFIPVLGLMIAFNTIYADAATDKMKISVDSYRKAFYGTAIRNGVEAIDIMYQNMLDTIVKWLPELKDFKTKETNYFYQFSSDLGSVTHSFQLWKTMENNEASVKIIFDNSLFELNRINNLFISMDYLKSSTGYAKLALTNGDTVFNIIRENDKAYAYYPFEIVDSQIKNGLMIKIDIAFKKSYDEKKKTERWMDIVKQVLTKLKMKTLQFYMQ
ncbi:MAG: hypothetical protein HPY53_10930 [Brevinematales bacterium]|nr:hypothetical protein [Brevinematales bacterium]